MSYLTSGLSSLSDFDTYSKALCTCTVMILLYKDACGLAGSMQAQYKTARFFQASHHAHAMKWYKTDGVDVSAAIAAACVVALPECGCESNQHSNFCWGRTVFQLHNCSFCSQGLMSQFQPQADIWSHKSWWSKPWKHAIVSKVQCVADHAAATGCKEWPAVGLDHVWAQHQLHPLLELGKCFPMPFLPCRSDHHMHTLYAEQYE